ncbi:MAG: hypothetical protein ACRC18_07005 [Cetobacterium sp.]
MLNSSIGKFKITEEVKNNLCRVIKEDAIKELKHHNSTDFTIMYNADIEHFFIAQESVEKLEYEGYIFYKNIELNDTDKITIKNIKSKIWNR